MLRCHSTHVNTIHCLQSVAFLYQAAPQCRASRHQAADAEVASAVLRQTNSNANGRIVRIVVVGCPRSPRVLRDLALWRWRRSRPLHGLLRLGLSGGPSGSWSLLWLRANHTDIEHGPILPPETKRDLRPWNDCESQSSQPKNTRSLRHDCLLPGCPKIMFLSCCPFSPTADLSSTSYSMSPICKKTRIRAIPQTRLASGAHMNISCPCRSPLRVHVCNSQNSPRPATGSVSRAGFRKKAQGFPAVMTHAVIQIWILRMAAAPLGATRKTMPGHGQHTSRAAG